MHSQTAENNVDQNIIIFWSHIGARTVLPHISKDIPILFAPITENNKKAIHSYYYGAIFFY